MGRRRLGELAGRVRAAGAVSAYNAEELEALGFPEPAVLGVMRSPLPAAPRPPSGGGPARLLFVGRGIPNKAQHHLLLASAALRDAGIDHVLDLVGSWGAARAYEEHCRTLAEALGLERHVRFRGSVSDVVLAAHYAAADVFLCLSDHEGFCVPLVEAMAAGLPVVAYASTAIPETVAGGEAPFARGRGGRRDAGERGASGPDGGGAAGAPARHRPRGVRAALGRLRGGDPLTELRLGATAPPAIARLLERVAVGLPPTEAVLAAGVDDPRLAASLPPGPRVVVPALGRRLPGPAAGALLGSAGAVVLLDPSEATAVRGYIACPVVVAGVPRPTAAATGHGLAVGDQDALAEVWRSEYGDLPDSGPGVAWVGGASAAPLVAAAEAWAAGRAVVVVPGAPRHEILARGGALVARTSLEALEATRFLLAARPLTEALARRGRRALGLLPTIDDVLHTFVEALLLATEGGDER